MASLGLRHAASAAAPREADESQAWLDEREGTLYMFNIYVGKSNHDLTATSLEMMVSKVNYPQNGLISVTMFSDTSNHR